MGPINHSNYRDIRNAFLNEHLNLTTNGKECIFFSIESAQYESNSIAIYLQRNILMWTFLNQHTVRQNFRHVWFVMIRLVEILYFFLKFHRVKFQLRKSFILNKNEQKWK